jgi:hypothetical protein
MESNTKTARENGDERTPLDEYRIESLPRNFYYIPNFISPEEEASILSKVRRPLHFLRPNNTTPDPFPALDAPLTPPPASAPIDPDAHQHAPRRATASLADGSNYSALRDPGYL